jgi:Na+/pantothenate symporter
MNTTAASIHQSALVAGHTPNLALDLAFGAAFLVPFALMAWLVIRQRIRRAKRRRASAFNERTPAYHERLNNGRGLYTRRGHALAETLAALALCLVWSALLLALLACSDAADLAALIRP